MTCVLSMFSFFLLLVLLNVSAIIILYYSASLWTEFTSLFLLCVNEKNGLDVNTKDLASLRGKNLASLRE